MQARIEELFSVNGRAVAITGAAGTLFSAIAKALAANGAKVALLGRTKNKVDRLAQEITGAGGEAIGIQCDVLETSSVQAALDKVLASFGKCDVLINGVGGNLKDATVKANGKFTDLPLEELDKVFALNYKGTLLPTQIFCKYFATTGVGCVINTSSMSALRPLTNVLGYSNAKAAVTNLTQWLAVQTRVDYPRANIRVNEIAPGFLDTTQNHFLLFEPDNKTLTRRGQSIISHTPMGRLGNPDELIGAIVLLISDAGSFMNGVTIPIDGGFNVYSGVGPIDEGK